MEPRSAIDPRFVLIGGGNMGEAIVRGWLASKTGFAAALQASDFIIVEPTAERRDYLEKTYGVTCLRDAQEVSAAGTVVGTVVLAVKPQAMPEVLASLATVSAFEGSLFISIVAGMTTKTLEQGLPASSRLVRVMPNLPLLVGEGATAVCGSSSSTEDDIETVQDLFSCLGLAERVDEDMIDTVTAVSGSGPAYVAAMIEAMVAAGAKQGLPESLAEALVLQTVYGTAKQLVMTGQSPTEFRKAVSSPGGTTLAALEAMRQAGMESVYDQGVAAAVRRAKELATCKP